MKYLNNQESTKELKYRVSENLKYFMKKRGVRSIDFDSVGVSQSQVSYYTTGRRLPSLPIVLALCSRLDITVEQLVGPIDTRDKSFDSERVQKLNTQIGELKISAGKLKDKYAKYDELLYIVRHIPAGVYLDAKAGYDKQK